MKANIIKPIILAVITIILVSGLFPPWLSAEEKPELEDLFNMSFDELIKVYIATKTEISKQEAPSIVSVITGEHIRNMGARDIIDVLRTVPGFDLSHMGVYPMHQAYVRGMTSAGSEKLKVMINGHSIQPLRGGPDIHFDKLPITSIRQIEIIRGPGSALYGTGAFLGVINIITKEGGDELSRLSLEGGSYDTVKPYGEFSYKKDDMKAYLNAEYYTTNGYDGTVESDMAMVLPGFVPSASREMTGSSEHFIAQANIGYKQFYFSGLFKKGNYEIPIGIEPILTDEDDVNTYFGYGELGYRYPVIDKANMLVRAYYDYSGNDPVYESYPEETAALHIGFPADEGVHAGGSGKWSVSGIEISGDYEPWSGVQMVAGTSYEYHRQFDVRISSNSNKTGDFLEVDGIVYPPYPFTYFPGGLTDVSENGNWLTNETRSVTALYAQCTADLKEVFSLEKGVENLAVTIGARYDNYDDVGSSTNPRLGLVYAPMEKLWFKALYGTAFRAPNFLEMYMKNTPAHGNPDLAPEEINTAEFLVGYQFTRMISSSITGFYVTAENMIRLVPLGAGIVQYENVAKIESYGMETELKAAFGKNKYAYLNFTWQDVKDTSHKTIFSGSGQAYTDGDFDPGFTPDFYGNIGVNYGFTENIIVNMSINYVGERDRNEEKMWAGETLIRIDTREPVDDRWLLNASLTFKNILAKGLDFQISGFNLLNQDHRDPDITGFIENDIPRPGATFYSRISYSF